MPYKVSVIIEKDEHGYYAYSPELDGCQSQGDTMEQAIGNIREAVELYLETLSKPEKIALLSKDIFSTSLEVKVAKIPAPECARSGAPVAPSRICTLCGSTTTKAA